MNPLRSSMTKVIPVNGNLLPTFRADLLRPRSSSRANIKSQWICNKCQSRASPSSRSYSTGFSREILRNHNRVFPIDIGGRPLRRAFSQSYGTRQESPASNRGKDDSKLPSHEESRRSDLNKRLSSLMDHMQANIFIAGQRLNDLTGYSGIESLKKDIEVQEAQVSSNRRQLQEAKEAYASAINQRSASQKEVNELLQRKNSWSPQDLERFTALYRSDHANEQAESSAQEAVTAAERAAEEASGRLSSSILARYHEEQIWSDKIRRMSTWGTWGLMGVNILLFLVFQIGVEPWRRKRLVKGFEDKVVEALENEGIASNVAIAALKEAQMVRLEPAMAAEAAVASDRVPETVVAQPLELSDSASLGESAVPLVTREPEWSTGSKGWRRTLGRYKASVAELFSHQTISVRRVDLTAAAIEGAFVGLAFTAVIAAILRR